MTLNKHDDEIYISFRETIRSLSTLGREATSRLSRGNYVAILFFRSAVSLTTILSRQAQESIAHLSSEGEGT